MKLIVLGSLAVAGVAAAGQGGHGVGRVRQVDLADLVVVSIADQ